MTENCHVKAKFSNKDGLSGWPTLTPNGPVVDLVAVRVRAGEFFAGHGR